MTPSYYTGSVVYRITTECIGNESRFIECDRNHLTEVISSACSASFVRCPGTAFYIDYIILFILFRSDTSSYIIH